MCDIWFNGCYYDKHSVWWGAKKRKNKLSYNPNNVQNQVKRNFQKVADLLSVRWKAIYRRLKRMKYKLFQRYTIHTKYLFYVYIIDTLSALL